MQTNHAIATPTPGQPGQLQAFFMTPYDQYADRHGQQISLVAAITTPDDKHDAEVLPMFKVQFLDGEVIEAWPEEIASGEHDVTEYVARAALEAQSNQVTQ